MQITQIDIARRLGISQPAVVYALSENPRLSQKVRPETRQRVLDTAKQLGYVPNHAARRLIRGRFRKSADQFDQVGLITILRVDDFLDPICHAMMAGAERELSKHHASLTFVRVLDSGDWSKVERLARAGGVDGWLLYGVVDDEVLDRLKPAKLPFVVLGDHRCTQPVPCANVDNFAAGRLAVQHLASLGHRRIGFLSGGAEHLYERQTLDGFREALKEFGLDEDERLIGYRSWTDDPAKQMVEWLRNSGSMPSAVFTPELDLAPTVRVAFKAAQIEVPQDISLLGYECFSLATKRESFTRIELPVAEVGRKGALLLHRLASGQRAESEINISPSLIEGRSTCPPSSPTGGKP
jgi:LacI family transcriptional regulator